LDDPRRLQRPANVVILSKGHAPPWLRENERAPSWAHYTIAILATLITIEIDRAIGLVSSDGRTALLPMLIPIVVSASLGGLGPGLTATATAALAAHFFFLPPPTGLAAQYTSHQVALIALVATGALISIFSGELHRTRSRAEACALRLSLLAQAESVLASSLDYAATLRSASQLCIEGSASLALFHLLAEDGSTYLASCAHSDPRHAPRLAEEARFSGCESPQLTQSAVRTMTSGSPLLVPKIDDGWIRREAFGPSHARFMREFAFRSLLVVPVAASDGRILGTLTLAIAGKSTRKYDKDDLLFAEELGWRVGRAVEKGRQFAREVAYRRIVETTHDGILMLDRQRGVTFANQRMVDLLGYTDASEIAGRPLADFLAGDASTAQKHAVRRAHSQVGQDELCFLRRDGTALWALSAETAFLDQQASVSGAISLKMVTDITERKRAEAQLTQKDRRFATLTDELRHAGYHDVLTGLPNRELFLARLDRVLPRAQHRNASVATVLFVDIDRFKVVNDSLGQVVGDQLLAAFAERLSDCLRPYDLLARLGGDEFAILIDDVATADDAALAAERILRALDRPFSLAGRKVSITASVGVTLAPSGFENAAGMLHDAGMAMSRAKQRGGARSEFFAPELHSRAVTRFDMEIELRRALDCGNLRLAYQPIIAIATGRLIGFEALARWKHGEVQVAPDVFIPLAEETGLIFPLGSWVLSAACRQARIWRDLRPDGPPVAVSVNVSAKQLVGSMLENEVQRVLAESELDAERLHLEITESVLMERGKGAEDSLAAVRSLGVKIHLDDFGTGYSSLGYLQNLPIDTIKIDRSFVSDGSDPRISNLKIVQSIVALARSLDKDVTAEGVETPEQLHELCTLNCANAQGYYLSRPLDEASARAFLHR
jgi:diguanylate cyclase (GGDEF)-like protein/PAS domain S-box-containing protein